MSAVFFGSVVRPANSAAAGSVSSRSSTWETRRVRVSFGGVAQQPPESFLGEDLPDADHGGPTRREDLTGVLRCPLFAQVTAILAGVARSGLGRIQLYC